MNILKSIDIFSSPFKYYVDSSKDGKKTIIGGFLSFIVICLSLIYFIVLMH